MPASIPNPFNPLTDQLPAEIDKEFDKAIEAAKANNEEALLNACHAIEAYFNFPETQWVVKKAEVPGGMYSNMVAQLKQLNSMDILEKAMNWFQTVRLAAGLPPLVTPTARSSVHKRLTVLWIQSRETDVQQCFPINLWTLGNMEKLRSLQIPNSVWK